MSSDFHESLNEALLESYAPTNLPPEATEEGEDRAPWEIQDMNSAAWASRKLQAIHEKQQELNDWAKAETERIKTIQANEQQRLEHQAGFFEFALRAYLNRLIREGRRTKTLELPGGKFSLTKRQPLLNYDEQELLKFAEEHEMTEILHTTIRVDKTALKNHVTLTEDGKLVTQDGLILPGNWEQQPDSHKFTPSE